MFDIEQQLLRLITLRPEMIVSCGDLAPHHFKTRSHGKIFSIISKMYDTKKGISLAAISAYVDEDTRPFVSQLASVRVDGGAKHLADCIKDNYIGAVTAEAARSYADILETKKGRQNVISELISKLSRFADNDSEERLTTADLVTDRILDTLRNPDKHNRIVKTGIGKLDYYTGGVQAGMMTIVSGVPGMGKSTLMANIIVNMALSGEHVYLASLEDQSDYVVGRIHSRLTGINSEYINKGKNIGLSEIEQIEQSLERNRPMLSRIHIDDSAGQNVLKIRRTCDYLKSKGELGVAVVDHMGEIAGGGRNKYESASHNAESLRNIAKEFDIPLVAGAQVARSAVSANAHGANINHEACIPRAHHLRDSGRIEEVARNIWFVHRPHKWNQKNDANDFWINVDKATHGTTSIIKLKCDLKTMRITDEWSGNDETADRY